MRILVTGGFGYIGSLLVPALLAAGHRVTVVDRILYDPNSLNSSCYDARFSVIRADVRNVARYLDALKQCDIFIPLAALVGAPICDINPIDATSVNHQAINGALWQLSREQRIIFPATNSGYGQSDIPCDEETPLKPLSLYAKTKFRAEADVLQRGNCVTFRLATAFGVSPRFRRDLLLHDFVWRAYQDRSITLFEPYFKRNFISVRDIARVFLHAIDNFDEMKDRPYNVGLSNANLNKIELCERIRKYVPEFTWSISVNGRDPDQRDYVVSNARIEATGWLPQYNIYNGIEELLKLYPCLRRYENGNV